MAALLCGVAGGLLSSQLLSAAAAPQNTFHFEFGPRNAPGRIQVLPTTLYTKKLGYGFDPAAGLAAADLAGSNSLSAARQSSSKLEIYPYYFSVALPEGNYNVTVTFGADSDATTNTVRAESRRLMLQQVLTAPGQFLTRTFTVNVRTPGLPGEGKVRLKERERGALDWDDKLTLEFNGARVGLCVLDITPATNAITVFLLGDSTVTDQPREPWNSWGQMLPRFFTPGVAVANHAESGESLKSSLGARRVEKVLASLKPGDYVFVQFGHNDQKDRATNALAVYQANLKQLVADIRTRGAMPVLVTSMERMAGVEKDTLGDYPATMIQVAKEEHVLLIDLHAMSRQLYLALGPNLKLAFQDGTHHNAYGSYELAKCVIAGICRNRLDLAKFITDDFSSFDPAHPDPVEQFYIPPSPSTSTTKPDGS